MAKSSEQTQVDFIVDFLRKGERYNYILAQFGTKWHNVSKRTFDRRYKVAEIEAQYEQQRIKHKAEQSIEKQSIELGLKILTVLERQAILSEIARGEMGLSKPMVVDKDIVSVPVVPDWMDRKNAIAELNKMDGSYAPTKQEISVNKPVIIDWSGTHDNQTDTETT